MAKPHAAQIDYLHLNSAYKNARGDKNTGTCKIKLFDLADAIQQVPINQ